MQYTIVSDTRVSFFTSNLIRVEFKFNFNPIPIGGVKSAKRPIENARYDPEKTVVRHLNFASLTIVKILRYPKTKPFYISTDVKKTKNLL